jgi:hypothetical protein
LRGLGHGDLKVRFSNALSSEERFMKYLVVALAALTLISCATPSPAVKVAGDFPELNVLEDGAEPRYLIATIQYRGNDIGEIQDVTGYRVEFVEKALSDGSTFYHLVRMEKADTAKTSAELKWSLLSQLKDLKVIVGADDDLNSAEQYLQQIPHDSMDTYNVYVSLMDIVSYKNYVRIATKELGKTAVVYHKPGRKLYRSRDWTPTVKEITFEENPTDITLVGVDGEGHTVYYYKSDNTKIHQTISTQGLTMPSQGTTRFMGFIKLDTDGTISGGTLSEYFSMEIWPMFFMKMNMLVRREQVLQRL